MSRLSRILLLGLLLQGCYQDPSGPGTGDEREALGEADDQRCAPGDPTDEALVPGGMVGERSAVIPGGRMVAPEGVLVPLGRAAQGLAVSPDGTRAYVTCDGDANHALQVIDLEAGEVVQTITGFSAFRGVQVSDDGRTVVVAAGKEGKLLKLQVQEDQTLAAVGELELTGFLGDLALYGGEVLVASNTQSVIYRVDLDSMVVTHTIQSGNYPYDMVADEQRARLYVSNLADDSVQVIDLETNETMAWIDTARGPEAMVSDGERLYVPCAHDDVVQVMDLDTLQVVDTIDFSHHPEGLLASTPNDVSLSPDGGVLYTAQADLNQVDLLDVATGELLGSLATGWYPSAVRAMDDGERILILASKGLGGSRDELTPDGLLQILALPRTQEELDRATERVWANNSRPSRFYPNECPQVMDTREDGTPPIEHVVLIVRENKTYDMVLGDLEGTNGDPELTLFGEEYTPNLHALAREFTNMDNFFHDAENSIQGHMWTTQADCSDFVDKLRISQLPLAGYEPASMTSANDIFEHCLEHGVSFRNYGEFASFGPELMGRMRDFIDPKFPFFNMNIRDEAKAREVIREWELGIFPQFIYIGLPNDHTFGSKPGKPTPQSMVADNDYATGLLVDWISHSPYWESTAVFIIEDDPQSWHGDHVDAHRSICVVASPWVKRGYVSHVHYDIPSLYRTIEMLLGLPPMNKNDDRAAPMYDVFRSMEDGPDTTPFEVRPLAVEPAVNTKRSPMAAESEALEFDGVDGVPGLGKILWRVMKGDVEPPDYAKGVDL